MERGGGKNRKEKSIYNPVVHPKFLSLCTGGSKPPFQSARASVRRAARPLPAPVTRLQFEVAAMGLSSSRSMLELVGCRLL